jgi:hypothetical protein
MKDDYDDVFDELDKEHGIERTTRSTTCCSPRTTTTTTEERRDCRLCLRQCYRQLHVAGRLDDRNNTPH